jgi:E3 ubiquitin-protein ligase CCNP1IP1
MKVDHDSLRRKNEELALAFREKSRKHLQTQELYDKLKRRAMLGQVQEAALDAVDHTIQASVAGNRFTDRVSNEPQRPPPPLFSNEQHSTIHNLGTQVHSSEAPMGMERASAGGWAGFSSQGSVQRKTFVRLISTFTSAYSNVIVLENRPIQTPSTHRHRLGSGIGPGQGISLANRQPSHVANTPVLSRRVSPREPLASLSGNIGNPSGFAGYGMSAGLKVSNPAGVANRVLSRSMIRPRGMTKASKGHRQLTSSVVAQRSSPGDLNSGFNPSRTSNMFSNADNCY